VWADHYITPRGHHGQQVHFIVWYKGEIVGIISGGGPVFACAPRDAFFGKSFFGKEKTKKIINGIVDNTTFHLSNHEPNLGSRILSLWERVTSLVWKELYGAEVYGFETFVLPKERLVYGDKEKVTTSTGLVVDPQKARGTALLPGQKEKLGAMYKAANWTDCGMSAGSTKSHDGVGLTGGREGGKGKFLRKSTPPKQVLCKWAKGHSKPIEFEYKSSWKAATKEGTPEEKALAKEKSLKRKTYLGTFFYRKGNQIIHEKFQQKS